MKEAVSKDEIVEALNLGRYPITADILMRLTGLDEINKMYAEIYDSGDMAFIDELFKRLSVSFEPREEDLKRLPKKGGFITVSNHPFGALDGLLLIKLLHTARPDSKVMANFLLQRFEPIADLMIPVNPFETRGQMISSLSGMRNAFTHISKGHPLGIFPAGEVSTYDRHHKRVTDKEWNKSSLKLIRKAAVPVVPVYFHGSNSLRFHLLGILHPSLRTLQLPGEFLKKNRKVRIRVGAPIPVRELDKFEDIDRMGRFLRAKTYAMGSALSVKPFFRPTLNFPKRSEEIPEASDAVLLINELKKNAHQKLLSKGEFDLFVLSSGEAPTVVNEIGRLREITFREVGEGTNKARDLDEFDVYYRHLVLWDRKEETIAGAYRLGLGSEILPLYGKKGFYTHSLFKIREGFVPALSCSVELGRSFVTKAYQRKRLPLFLLWNGILRFIEKHSEVKYLIGPVSISNDYSEISKSLTVSVLQSHYFDSDKAQYIRPRKPFRVRMGKQDIEALLENSQDNLRKVDKIIADIEPRHFTLPLLLKKYLGRNAKIIGFNIDPKFNNALDALMILNLADLPKETTDNFRIH